MEPVTHDLWLVSLDFASETAFLSLCIPLFNPSIRTHGGVHFLEIVARLEFFSLDLLAAVEINITLIAIPEYYNL